MADADEEEEHDDDDDDDGTAEGKVNIGELVDGNNHDGSTGNDTLSKDRFGNGFDDEWS